MSSELPKTITVALSVRQPWAWLIVNGHKDIENRTKGSKRNGSIAIHASNGITQAEYRSAKAFAAERGVTIPPITQLERGGIVGYCQIAQSVRFSSSKWFVGPHGWPVEQANRVDFIPMKGALGFFKINHLAPC